MQKVIELNERLRFEVLSTTRAGDDRLVDMGQFEGNGECSCWTFCKQIRGPLDQHIIEWKADGGKPFTYQPADRYQCEHIKAVKSYLANRLVQQVRKQFPDHEQNT